MQRDSAVPRPIQRNINATAADLDMNWRRGAPAPAPAPAARPPAPRLAAPKESPWGAVPAAPAADLRSGGGGGPAPRPAAERAPAARASARGSRGAREGGRPGREAGGAARRGGDGPRASPERRPRDAPRPPPSPPRPPYVPPPAPWAGAARAARPAAAPTRDFPTLGAAPPPAPPPEPPRAAAPRAPEPAAPRDRAVARGAAAPRNPWGAPGGPAQPAPGGDFPALAPPARNSPPVVLAALDKPAGAGYLKPKPQANFVVFDVLTSKLKQKAPRGKKAPETPKPAPAPAPRPPGADDDRPAAPDKVRKKKLSSLKKRILLERAERWYELHPEARPAPTIRDEATSGAFADATGVGRRFVVRVDNVARSGELEDAEERDEILRDVGCLCSHFAPVVAVEVAPAAGGGPDDFAPIDVSFAARDDAAAALAGLERRVVGGVALRAAERPPSPPPDSASTAARVFGALDADDAADADAVDETRDDLARLAEAYGPLAAPVRLEPSRVAALHGCLDAVLDFGDARAAARAVAGLGRTTIGGATLLCDVEPAPGDAVAVVLGGALGGVDAGDADEVDEALGDLRAVVEARAPALLVAVAARGADVLATFGSARAAARAAAALAGVVLGGEPLSAAVATADGAVAAAAAPAAPAPAAPAAPDTYTDARGQLVKLPPKYAAARHVPKVPNAAPVQPYATAHPLDRTLDGLVAALLARLFEFQERVRLNDPIKAKMRRRLVFGLREVRRGIRADNVKVVVVAPNIDEGSTLAKSVDEILDAARDMGVPVVFALGKRKLGRALRKSVGVSAVGVYSGDGAYDEYRAVTNRLKELQRDPACAVDPAFVQEQRQRGRAAEPKPDGAPPRTDQADAPSAKRPRGRRKAPQTQPAKPPAPSFDFQPPLPGAAQQPPPQLWPAPYVAF